MSKEKTVKIIREIQKYPYDSSANKRGLSVEEQLARTREVKRGTCTTKHELLAAELKTMGFIVAFLTYPFYWQDLKINASMPRDLENELEKMPQQNHLALGLFIDGEIKIIDVTWDPSLRSLGLSVPRISLPIESLELAVVPSGGAKIHFDIHERKQYLQKTWEESRSSVDTSLFYIKLSAWIESLRK